MRRLKDRIAALEKDEIGLTPAVKAWLGHPLTEAEQRSLDEGAGIDPGFDEYDTGNLSAEMKQWLGVN